MASEARIRRFRRGLCLCWAAILAVPVGLTQVSGGPCRVGPDTAAGSIFLLMLGPLSTVGAGIGVFGVTRGLRTAEPAWRLVAVFSMFGACLAMLPGLVLFMAGFGSTMYQVGKTP